MAAGKTMVEVESSGRIIRNSSGNPRTPYPHQIDAMNNLALIDKKLPRYSTLVVLPTGGGKTYTLSNWLLKYAVNRHKKVLWIAHRQMLLDQAAQSFQQFSYDAVCLAERQVAAVSRFPYYLAS